MKSRLRRSDRNRPAMWDWNKKGNDREKDSEITFHLILAPYVEKF